MKASGCPRNRVNPRLPVIALEGRNVLRTAGGGVMDFSTTEHDGIGSMTFTAPGMGSVTIRATAADAMRLSIAAGRLSYDCTLPAAEGEE